MSNIKNALGVGTVIRSAEREYRVERVLGAGGYGKPKAAKGDSIPVQATFYDFVDYANKLSRAEGYDGFYSVEGDLVSVNPDGNGYRLPTIYEWMFAAKGANNHDTYKYAGSDTLKNVAWYGANSGNVPHKVGSKQPNSIGLYDMSGNLSEFMWSKTWDGGFGTTSGVNYYYWTSTYIEDTFGFSKESIEGVRLVFVPRDIKNENLTKDYPDNTIKMKLIKW